ncbi:hypothetical protein J6590_047568 [Homalodisca vitripennis]|nr:hypothetical protein J6590_047568 [Homalodisca vitripennis]
MKQVQTVDPVPPRAGSGVSSGYTSGYTWYQTVTVTNRDTDRNIEASHPHLLISAARPPSPFHSCRDVWGQRSTCHLNTAGANEMGYKNYMVRLVRQYIKRYYAACSSHHHQPPLTTTTTTSTTSRALMMKMPQIRDYQRARRVHFMNHETS